MMRFFKLGDTITPGCKMDFASREKNGSNLGKLVRRLYRSFLKMGKMEDLSYIDR